LRKDIARTLCAPSISLRSGLPAYFASKTDHSQQRQASMASGRDRVQVLAGHFASSSTEGQTLDIQAQCTRAATPMLAGQVRKCSAGAEMRAVCPDFESLQVAIITGSGQGVGAAAAKLFAEHGAKVVVTDIDSNKSEQVLHHSALQLHFLSLCNKGHCLQVASEIREAGGEAMSVPGDVTAEGFASKIVKATIDKYGALHVLVNNAGQLSLVLMQTRMLPTQC